MIFTYMNRETSLNNKYNKVEKNNVIVAVNNPPPDNIQANKTNYITIQVKNSLPPKFSRQKLNPQRNPIKHYRRQYATNNTNRHIDLNTINLPGKTIVKTSEDCPTCNLSNTQFIKDTIIPNNNPCFTTFSYQDTDPYLWKTMECRQKIKPPQPIMSQEYSPSIQSFRERRGKTYENNICHNNQNVSKNSGICNNDNNSEYITKTSTISNGTTSISSYKIQSGYNYSDETNILNNSLCCNNVVIKSDNPNFNNTKCYRNLYPNLLRQKLIC